MPRRPIRTEDQRVEFIPNYLPFRPPIPIPTAGICDTPSTMYCINNEWRAYFIGAMQSLVQMDVWDSEDEELVLDAIQQVLGLISMPTAPCSPFGGAATDSGQNDEILSELNQQIFDVGGLPAIAPTRPDTTFDFDSGDDTEEQARRLIALCWATHDYVNSVAEKGILQAVNIQPGIVLVGAVLAVLAFPVYGIVFVAATAALIVGMSAALNGDEDITAVACCMNEALIGQTVTEANFAASLDSCPDLSGTGQLLLAELVQTTLGSEKNWLAFVKSLGSFMNATDDVSRCPCADPQCALDFRIDEGNWVNVNNLAFYVDGVGWRPGLSGVGNHILHFQFTASPVSDLVMIRFTIKNDETNDADVRFRLIDDLGGIIEQEDAVLSAGQTSMTFVLAAGLDYEIMRFRAIRQGLEVLLNIHVTDVEILSGDCVFPEQPV